MRRDEVGVNASGAVLHEFVHQDVSHVAGPAKDQSGLRHQFD
jgi:hypothetical protein